MNRPVSDSTEPNGTKNPAAAPDTDAAAPFLLMPDAPVLVVGVKTATWLNPDGSIEHAPNGRAASAITSGGGDRVLRPIVCHMPAVARRLAIGRFQAHDLLELFAFARPAVACVPTPRGLAKAAGLTLDDPTPAAANPDEPIEEPGSEAQAAALLESAQTLLRGLSSMAARERPARVGEAIRIALSMNRAGWLWGPSVLAALGALQSDGSVPPRLAERAGSRAALQIWTSLPEFSEHPPEPPPANEPVEPEAAQDRLEELRGPAAERRAAQTEYAGLVSAAFRPRRDPDMPEMVLAEAGTGVGKTLGYVAPAMVWSERNAGAVWISTYTRNLQHQIDDELSRAYPDEDVKARRVVIRKGRENYLCLLNYEEAVDQVSGQLALPPPPGAGRAMAMDGVALGLMARWIRATRGGDMNGGDFPAWLPDLLGRGRTLGLADRRGECIYSACPHYRRCFIERGVRRARRADFVIANHALVMVQGALGGMDDTVLPSRYVFDEGHHLFDAADSAFSAHLTAAETADLRRWLIGAETSARSSRVRGLKRRVEDLAIDDERALEALDAIGRAARTLPGDGWRERIEMAPKGSAEAFFQLVRRQVYARAPYPDSPYGLETETNDPVDGLLDAAITLDQSIGALARPMFDLIERFGERLIDEAEELDTPTRLRLEALIRSLNRRAGVQLEAWRGMLQGLGWESRPEFVDWFAVERFEGRDIDVGLHRHWIDPTEPFADQVLKPAHGVLVTSATLTDGSGDAARDWAAAAARTGADHLSAPAEQVQAASPFDYPEQTRVFVVGDVRKDSMDQVASAYRTLFLAAGGGALGLFTAISRLRAVHKRIAEPLDEAGLSLLAQHVDGMNTTTLIDIFRAERDSCLLGTDAARDGVDVPGDSLRLIVFDRVPWPRPDILHRARRSVHGERTGDKRGYDDLIARLRLKQAFGRLVRRAGDRGVFVLLDPMMPTRLTSAFPEGVETVRCGLAEAVAETKAFLEAEPTTAPPL